MTFYMQNLRLSLVLLLMSLLASCGMTPQEQAALKRKTLEQQKAQKAAQQREIAKVQFALKKDLLWQKQANFKFEHLEKGAGIFWQSITEKEVRQQQAVSYCENKAVTEFGLTAANFRLPTTAELVSVCKNSNILIRKSNTFYVVAEDRVERNGRRDPHTRATVKTSSSYWNGIEQCAVNPYRIGSHVNFKHDGYIKCVTDNPFKQSVMELALKLGANHLNQIKQDAAKSNNFNETAIYWQAYSQAVYIKYGYPRIKSAKYHQDKALLQVIIGSERGGLNQSIEMAVPITHGQKLAEILTAQSFSPTIKFDVIAGQMQVTGIKEIAQPLLVVERAEYHKAKGSIKSLQAFIVQYPKSKYLAKARSTLQSLQKVEENKRLAALELAKDNADGDIIGSKNFEGAQYKAGRIWQDQPVNRRFNVSYEEAKKHCEALTLLGVEGWRLPSENDYKRLGQGFKDFAYVASKPGYSTPYYTRDENCFRGGLLSIEKQHCVLTADPQIGKADKREARRSFRCVLSAYKYNENAKKQASKYINENTLDGYINAFKASGDDSHIRKAFGLAQSNDDLAKVEMALVQHFGLHKVFSLKGSLVTKNGSDAIRDEIDASVLLNMIASSGNAEFMYEVFPASNSIVPLKYGKYKVRLKVKLDLNYENTMEKGFLGMDYVTYETKSKEREFEVELTPDNNWKYSGTVDFGTIMHGAQGGTFIFKMNKNLKGIQPRFDLLSIERM